MRHFSYVVHVVLTLFYSHKVERKNSHWKHISSLWKDVYFTACVDHRNIYDVFISETNDIRVPTHNFGLSILAFISTEYLNT